MEPEIFNWNQYAPFLFMVAGVSFGYFFGPRHIKQLCIIGLDGVAVISTATHIQLGAGNPVLWHIFGWLCFALLLKDLKTVFTNRLPTGRERRAMRRLMAAEWWRVFTDDPRIGFNYQTNFNGMKL